MVPQFDCVLIDYGHGGLIGGVYQTAGKQYHHLDRNGKVVLSLYEGVSNRQTAVRLIRHLIDAGVRVEDCVARRSWSRAPASWQHLEQHDVPLKARTAYINGVCRALGASRCLLVSLHSNAVGNRIQGPSQPARGVDLYTTLGQDASDAVATSVHAAMAATLPAAGLPVRRGDLSDGDPDRESDFWVLRKSTTGAAILPETGFFTNLDDARFLASNAGQDAIAAAIFTGLQPHLVARAV